MVKEYFQDDPELQETIRNKFERMRGLTDSEMLMDSNTSDHQLNLMLMMQGGNIGDDSLIEGGNNRDKSNISYF